MLAARMGENEIAILVLTIVGMRQVLALSRSMLSESSVLYLAMSLTVRLVGNLFSFAGVFGE